MDEEERPTETKLYNGSQYSVNVLPGEAVFIVVIGDGEHRTEEKIACNDVSPENYQELFKRAHEHAQKIIDQHDSLGFA